MICVYDIALIDLCGYGKKCFACSVDTMLLPQMFDETSFLNIKTRLVGVGIAILKIRRSQDRLIFIMDTHKLGKIAFILKQGPEFCTSR